MVYEEALRSNKPTWSVRLTALARATPARRAELRLHGLLLVNKIISSEYRTEAKPHVLCEIWPRHDRNFTVAETTGKLQKVTEFNPYKLTIHNAFQRINPMSDWSKFTADAALLTANMPNLTFIKVFLIDMAERLELLPETFVDQLNLLLDQLPRLRAVEVKRFTGQGCFGAYISSFEREGGSLKLINSYFEVGNRYFPRMIASQPS